jgi:hypothetical protein
MKDSRVGESLWEEWLGSGYLNFLENSDTFIFYTKDHVSMENDLVRRALASAIQRDGITDSLSESFKKLEGSEATFGWAGNSDFDLELMSCDELGYTDLGDSLTEVLPITWVKF